MGAANTGSDDTTPPRAGDDVVVLWMPLYKNPFLWFVGGGGASLTGAIAWDAGPLAAPVLVCAAITAALSLVAVLLYRAKLTIGPLGFREQMPFWVDVSHAWTEVSPFYIRSDDEALDAIGYAVAEGVPSAGPRHRTGGQFIAGAYPGSLQSLCDRLNAARERALARDPPGS